MMERKPPPFIQFVHTEPAGHTAGASSGVTRLRSLSRCRPGEPRCAVGCRRIGARTVGVGAPGARVHVGEGQRNVQDGAAGARAANHHIGALDLKRLREEVGAIGQVNNTTASAGGGHGGLRGQVGVGGAGLRCAISGRQGAEASEPAAASCSPRRPHPPTCSAAVSSVALSPRAPKSLTLKVVSGEGMGSSPSAGRAAGGWGWVGRGCVIRTWAETQPRLGLRVWRMRVGAFKHQHPATLRLPHTFVPRAAPVEAAQGRQRSRERRKLRWWCGLALGLRLVHRHSCRRAGMRGRGQGRPEVLEGADAARAFSTCVSLTRLHPRTDQDADQHHHGHDQRGQQRPQPPPALGSRHPAPLSPPLALQPGPV